MSNVISGALPEDKPLKGDLAMVFGKDGENGKSAYEIAVEKGFKGTEVEWLESLKAAVKLGSLTPDYFDRSYLEWRGRTTVNTFADLDEIIESDTSLNTAFTVMFTGLSPIKSLVGDGTFFALKSNTSESLLLTNVDNGEAWSYVKGSNEPTKVGSDDEGEYWEYTKYSFVEAPSSILNMLTEKQIMRVKALNGSDLYYQFGDNEAIAIKTADSYLLFDLTNGKRYKFDPMGGLEEIKRITDGDIDSEYLFSEAMREKYLGLPMIKATPASLNDDWFNSQTTPGIYQVRSSGSEPCVLIVLKPNTDFHLVQIKLGNNKFEYRCGEAEIPNVFFADSWTAWFDLLSTSEGNSGQDGFSPTAKVTQTEGGATITITDKDGTTTATVVNGKDGTNGVDGKAGYTPIKGVDYYTDTEKAEYEAFIATELAKRGQLKPEFANSIAECTDTSMLYVLPDGYIYAYMLTEVSKEPTNLLPLATDTDRVTVYNGKGFKENTRISGSSGSTSDATGIYTTGFIPAQAGDILYFKNMTWSNLSQKCYIIAFNSSNAITGKLEIQATTASPAPTSPLTLDSATFGSGFNAIRISASDISTNTVITVNEATEGGTTTGYGWKSTGHAFVPADYEERIADLENAVKDLKVPENNAVIPLVEFDYDHNLVDVSAMVSNFQVASHDLRKQKTVPTVYSLFDGLVTSHPDYVSRVDAAELVGLTYPTYANGITTAGTYAVTPTYKTYMYKLSYSNAYSGNESRHKHKRMLLIGGLDGSEYVPPYNLYILAKRLCEDFNEDSNLFKLRGSFDIYIVPCLNGYGLYHGTKYNANGVAITRNMPTKAWVEADAGDPNYYTGSAAGSEFETQLVMKLTEYIKPDIAIDHHSYGYLPTQFYSELPKEGFARLAYQSLVDCSMAFTKDLPQYFGTKFKLFQDREGATSAPAQVANVRGTQTWWDENGVAFGGLIEASVSINYLNGEPAGTGQDLYGNDTFSVAEYTLRNQLLRYAEYVLNNGIKSETPNVSGYVTEAQVLALIQANMPANGDEVDY